MIFQRLFGSKKLKKAVDISGLHTDMHSHLIPGIDDGAPDLDTALHLIRELKSLGYKRLITTPHIMADVYKNTPESIRVGFEKLQPALVEAGIDIPIEVAAEYQIDDGFEKHFKNRELLTFGDKYILIELPFFNQPRMLFDLTFDLQVAGYKIILAHPERYPYWQNDFSAYEKLKDRGIFFQLNIISLTGHYSLQVKKLAEKLIDLEMIDFLGSDMHNANYLRVFKESLYEPYLEKVVYSGQIKNHLI